MSKKFYAWFTCCLFALLTVSPLSVNALESLPYSYGFENNDLSAAGWTKSSADATNDGEFGIIAAAKHDGSYGFRFSSYSRADAYDQYLISPELDGAAGVLLTFHYAASSASGTEKFKVGYSTTDAATASFTFGEEISTNSTSWIESEEYSFPAGTKYVAIYYYSSYQYRLYVDDFRFEVPSSCQKPSGLTISNITSTSAVATWVAAGSESAWEISIDGGATRTNVTSATRTLSNLLPDTEYTVTLRAVCGNEYSNEISATFRTACAPITAGELPWTENFDAVTGTGYNTHVLPSCWSWINTSSSSSASYQPTVNNSTSYARSGSNSLYFYSNYSSYSDYARDQYAVLPPMADISSLRIKLWARAYSTGNTYDATFTVGVMGDPADPASFVPVATKTPASTTYEEFIIPFNKYTGNGEYIAIKLAAAASSTMSYFYRSVYIDDITVEQLPTCLDIANFAVALTEGNGSVATLSWSPADAESAWKVEYATDAEFTQAVTLNVSDTVAQLTGLTPDVTYYARAKAVCSATDEGAWSKVISFVPTNDVIVNDGTSTNAYVPVYGYYADAFTGSQFIIPASQLSTLLWGSITQLTFFASNESVSWGDAQFEVYMTETEDEVFNQGVLDLNYGDINVMQKVKNAGTLAIVGNKMIITLDAPYIYQGANLLIAFHQTVKGDDVSCSWLGETATYGSAVYGYSNSTPGVISTPASFLPKVQFAFTPGEAPACIKPGKLAVSNITAHTASLSWHGTDGATYEYVCLPDTLDINDVDLSANDIHAAGDTSAVISGLQSETGYKVWVRAICSENAVSDWSLPAAFRTIPSCWAPVRIMISEEEGAITSNSVLIEWESYEGQESSYLVTVKNGNEILSYNNEPYENKLVNGNSLGIRGLASATSYTLNISVKAVCAENDESQALTRNLSFSTLCEVISVFPWNEDFESFTASTIPVCWDNSASTSSTTTSSSSGSYVWGIYATSSNQMMRMNNFSVQTGTAQINSPSFALPASANYELTFEYSHTATCGDFEVKISDNDGASWTELAAYAKGSGTSNSDPGTFTEVTLSLAQYAGKTIMLQFFANANYGSGAIYVDNINIHEVSDCGKPSRVEVVDASITTTSAMIKWHDADNEAGNYLLTIKQDTAIFNGYENVAVNGDTTFVLTGLTGSSVYNLSVSIVKVCDGNSSLELVGAISFATACEAISAFPWNVSFEDMTASTVPNCWDNSGSATSTVSNNPSYVWGVYAYGGNKMLRMNNYSVYSGTALINTPSIVLPASPAYELGLDYAHTASCGNFIVKISDNGGASWANLATFAKGSGTSYTDPGAFTEATLSLASYAGKTIMLQFFANANFGTGAIYVDNVVVREAPSCLKPTGVAVSDITVEGATFSWDAVEGGAWKYAVVAAGEAEPQADAYIAVADTFVVITGLNDNAGYTFYVRQDCEDALSEAVAKSFHTNQVPADPSNYLQDFEQGNDWLFINGELTNAWVYGEAAHNGSGTHALYISNDGGATNAYTATSAVVTYAVKAFNFAEGSYNFKYDWKANGESTYDYLRVALVPANVQLVASTSLPTGLTTSTMPSNWIPLDGGSKLNLSTAWQTFESGEIAIHAGLYNVVLVWRDDTSDGAQTPAAVDNFSISKVPCSKLTNVVVADSSITTSSAAVSWNVFEGQNAWQIALDTIATFDPNTLESLISANSNPFTLTGLESDKNYYLYVRANCGDDGVGAWSSIVSFKTAKACQTPDGLALTAATINSASIVWNAYGQSSFELRYKADAEWLDTIAVNGNTYAFNGLDENTAYTVEVRALCGADDFSQVGSLTFRTTMVPAALPFSTDFETDASKWMILSGTGDNKWAIGSAVNNGGTSAAYISNDGGSTHAYTNNSSSSSIMFRLFHFEQGEYNLSFDWMGNGESTYDGMQVLLIPATVDVPGATFSSNTTTIGGISVSSTTPTITSAPADWILMLDPSRSAVSNSWFNLKTAWQVNQSSEFTINAEADYYLVFFWCNDNSVGTNPSAAVDNISIAKKLCGDMGAIAQKASTVNSVTIAWDAVEDAVGYEYVIVEQGADVNDDAAVAVSDTIATINGLQSASFYTVYVRAICSEGPGKWSSALANTDCDVLLATEAYNDEGEMIFGFEQYASNLFMKGEVLCWDTIGGVWKTTSIAHNGDRGATISALGNDSYGVLITPAFELLAEQELVAFVKEGPSHNDGDSVVFYINDVPSLDGAERIGAVAANADWREFRQKLPFDWFDEDAVEEIEQAYILIKAYAHNALFIDDIMLHEAPSCAAVKNIALEVTATSLTVTWEPGDEETDWVVSYNVKNANIDFADMVSGEPVVVINGLPAHTADSLFISIQSMCDGGAVAGEIVEAAYAFTTLCGEISELPWSENFNNIDDIPACWDNNEGTATYPWEIDNSGHTGSSLSFDSYYNPSNSYAILATPVINLPQEEAELVFWYRNYNGRDFTVYVSVNEGARQSLGSLTASTWTEKIVDLAAYAGQKVQFFFKATSSYSSTSGAAIYLDDVTVRVKPTCIAPANAQISNITKNAATLTWAASTTSDSYLVTILNERDEPITILNGDNQVLVNSLDVQGNSLVINNLEASTEYTIQIGIAADCGEGDISELYEDIISFETLCDAIAAPWSENFNDMATGSINVACWTNEHISGTGSSLFQVSSSTNGSNTTKQLQLPDMSTNTITRLSLPVIEIPAANAYAFKMKLYRNTNSTSYSGEGVRIYASYATGEVELGFISRNWTVANDIVPAETAQGWYEYEFTLPAAGDCRIILQGESKYGSSTFMDDLEVYALPTCFKPSNAELVALAAHQASFSWTGNADNYDVKVYNGTTLIADTIVAADALPFVIDTLQASTNYAFRFVVKGICSDEDESAEISTLLSFATLCEAVAIDDQNWWLEDFNSLTAGIPDCWNNEEGTTTSISYKWNSFETGMEGKCVRFNSYVNSRGNTNTLATPLLTLPQTAAQLVFWYKNPKGGDFNVAIAVEGGEREVQLSDLTDTNDWTVKKIMLAEYAGQTIQVFFNATSSYGTGDAYIYLDSVAISAAPNCMPVKNIDKASLTSNEVVFTWESNGSESAWDVIITDNLHENAVLFNQTVNANNVSLALEADTRYSMHVSVAANCGEGNVAEPVAADIVFRSLLSDEMIQLIPSGETYDFDLSSADEQALWGILGENETNHFIFANVNNHAGLYISNDNASWQYTIEDAPSASVAYRAFSVPEDNTPIEVSFMWEANGQSTVDYGRAFIASTDIDITIANHQVKFGDVQMTASNAIEGAYSILNNNSPTLSGIAAPQRLDDLDCTLNAGTYYIIFAWRNNFDAGAQNPLGIYDLRIYNLNGVEPTDINNVNGNGINVQKILRNGQVYIIRDGETYSILGTIVR